MFTLEKFSNIFKNIDLLENFNCKCNFGEIMPEKSWIYMRSLLYYSSLLANLLLVFSSVLCNHARTTII